MSIFIAPSLLSNEYMETAENLWHDAFERYGDRKTIRVESPEGCNLSVATRKGSDTNRKKRNLRGM